MKSWPQIVGKTMNMCFSEENPPPPLISNAAVAWIHGRNNIDGAEEI